jgi:hypothetical protein
VNPNLVLFLVAFLMVWAPSQARAQQPSVLPPIQHTHVVSTNLLGIVAKWFNVEYEHKAGESSSAGLSGSSLMIGIGDGDIRRANAFVRYYPQGSALNGFYIGARGGVLWNWVGDHQSAATAGLEIGHTTLYGRNKNVAVSVGFGLDRAWYEHGSTVIPNIRLFNIGVAF